MIRIVDQLVALSLDEDNAEEMKLPLVPATASVTIEDTAETEGVLRTISLAAVLSSPVRILNHRLVLKVFYCDGGKDVLGSEDLPLRLDVKTSDRIRISAKYRTREY